jgi:excisionase family DNA binding protein
MADVNISKIDLSNQTSTASASSLPVSSVAPATLNLNPPSAKTKGKRKKRKISLESLPDLLTVTEVAELLRVSSLTIKRWGKRGKLPAIRINSRGDRRYKKAAVLWLLGIQENKQ